jgi:hypothetical protein
MIIQRLCNNHKTSNYLYYVFCAGHKCLCTLFTWGCFYRFFVCIFSIYKLEHGIFHRLRERLIIPGQKKKRENGIIYVSMSILAFFPLSAVFLVLIPIPERIARFR